MSVTLRQCLPVVVVLCACYFSTLDGLAVRPFTSSKANPSCSGQTRNATLGCPCRLNGVPCRDKGSLCINKVCQCASGSTTADGTICLTLFNAVPTLTLASVPCEPAGGVSIPGLKISNTGGQLPLFCNTGAGTSTPITVTVISSQIDNSARVTNDNTTPTKPIFNQPYVEIDPTGDIFINSQPVLTMVPNDGTTTTPVTPTNAAKVLRQTYSGFCISNEGITSNTFTFEVEFHNCP